MFSRGVRGDELDRVAAAFGVALGHIALRFVTFTFHLQVPIHGERGAQHALQHVLDDLLYRIIDERTAGTSPVVDDLLAMLVDARDEDARQ